MNIDKRDLLDIQNDFQNPPNEYRAFRILHDIKGSSIEKDVIAKGFGGVVSNVSWNDKYLTDESAFNDLSEKLAEVYSNDMHAWIYDEYWYPSGKAGIQVAAADETFKAQCMTFLIKEGSGVSTLTLETPETTAYFLCAFIYPVINGNVRFDDMKDLKVSGNRFIADGIDGDWIIYAYFVRYMENAKFIKPDGSIADVTASPNPSMDIEHAVNVLDKKAMAKFVDLTYEAYKSHLDLKRIEAFFTDEPALSGVNFNYMNRDSKFDFTYAPYSRDLFEKFEKMHGYRLEPELHSLFSGISEKDRTLRLHYYTTIGTLFTENYFDLISDWCRKNGTIFSGHLLLEQGLRFHVGYYGNFIQAQKAMGIQGADFLQSDANPLGHEVIGTKFASSAARMIGQKKVMMEYCPVGPDLDKYRNDMANQLRGVANLIFFTGANHVNSYHTNTPEIDNPWNVYIGRLARILRNADSNAQIAVYYPIETMQSLYKPTPAFMFDGIDQPDGVMDLDNNLISFCQRLFKEKLDFNFLDSESILSSDSDKENMIVAGLKYKVLIMPFMQVVPVSVLEKIGEFEKSGGHVFWLEKLPSMGMTMDEHEIVRRKLQISSVNLIEDFLTPDLFVHLKNIITANLTIVEENGTNDIWISPYLIEGNEVNFVINTSDAPRYFNMSLKHEDTPVELYDASTGEIQNASKDGNICLEGFSSVFIVNRSAY
ncbi:MAG: glycosyl hydrolase family 2 protein [Saccharofermentanales bacterium]